MRESTAEVTHIPRRSLHDEVVLRLRELLIHVAINQAAKNPLLTKTYREINARVQSLRFNTNQIKAKWALAVKEHEQMVQALGARDGAAMRIALTEHLVRKRDTVSELLRAGQTYLPPLPAQ